VGWAGSNFSLSTSRIHIGEGVPLRSPYTYEKTIMNIDSLLVSLEFNAEIMELKKIGLTQEEIDGFFEFDWDILDNKFSNLIARSANDQH